MIWPKLKPHCTQNVTNIAKSMACKINQWDGDFQFNECPNTQECLTGLKYKLATAKADLSIFGSDAVVWQGECFLANLLFSGVRWKKVWRMNESVKRLLIVTATLDGFSLANHKQFAKYALNFLHLPNFPAMR